MASRFSPCPGLVGNRIGSIGEVRETAARIVAGIVGGRGICAGIDANRAGNGSMMVPAVESVAHE
eukprot:10458119-Alexandrium_andersonii.AAC.1